MKDIHSHILFSIDDGSNSIEESINILKNAVSGGYTDIVLTPHYRKRQNYVADNNKKIKKFQELKEEVKKNNININLYLGNEVTVDEDFIYYMDTNQITTINNSRYFLLELPFIGKLNYLDKLIDTLIDSNYVPVIVHPERYRDYKNLDEFISFINKGVLFQGNIDTLYGRYGENVQKKLENMLKQHMIHFLGSDIHHDNDKMYERDIKGKLKELGLDDNMIEDITNKNIELAILDKKILPYPIKATKKFKIFSRNY